MQGLGYMETGVQAVYSGAGGANEGLHIVILLACTCTSHPSPPPACLLLCRDLGKMLKCNSECYIVSQLFPFLFAFLFLLMQKDSYSAAARESSSSSSSSSSSNSSRRRPMLALTSWSLNTVSRHVAVLDTVSTCSN